MMRAVSILAIAAVLAPAGVSAAGYKTTCTRGEDARVIEVIAPGQVGQSCDVRYKRNTGVSVPYHADNSDAFCNEKARALAKRLSSAGFSCAAAQPTLRAEAQESDYVVEAQRIPQTEETALEEQPAQIVSASLTPERESAAPRPVALEPAPATLAPDTDEDALETKMNQILAQSPEAAPSGQPAQLVAQASETPEAGPQPSPVGRLTGADPDAPPPDASPAPASAPPPQTVEEPSAEPKASEPAPAPAAQTPPPAEKKAGLRTPAEVIEATLKAQAAAWNEGDLDGFMEGYWKSDDLKFVSGVEITRGWSATMKRYRDRYAGGQGLGRLNFERIEPKLVTDDVAVVTGRFSLLKDGVTSSGTFTLVMRRDNGAWRIVHDHTTADPASG